jgi:hypothetical protein
MQERLRPTALPHYDLISSQNAVMEANNLTFKKCLNIIYSALKMKAVRPSKTLVSTYIFIAVITHKTSIHNIYNHSCTLFLTKPLLH